MEGVNDHECIAPTFWHLRIENVMRYHPVTSQRMGHKLTTSPGTALPHLTFKNALLESGGELALLSTSCPKLLARCPAVDLHLPSPQPAVSGWALLCPQMGVGQPEFGLVTKCPLRGKQIKCVMPTKWNTTPNK